MRVKSVSSVEAYPVHVRFIHIIEVLQVRRRKNTSAESGIFKHFRHHDLIYNSAESVENWHFRHNNPQNICAERFFLLHLQSKQNISSWKLLEE